MLAGGPNDRTRESQTVSRIVARGNRRIYIDCALQRHDGQSILACQGSRGRRLHLHLYSMEYQRHCDVTTMSIRLRRLRDSTRAGRLLLSMSMIHSSRLGRDADLHDETGKSHGQGKVNGAMISHFVFRQTKRRPRLRYFV